MAVQPLSRCAGSVICEGWLLTPHQQPQRRRRRAIPIRTGDAEDRHRQPGHRGAAKPTGARRGLYPSQTCPARQTWLGDQRSGRLRSANTSFWRARRIIAMTGVGRRLSREALDAGGDPVNCAAARGRRNCGQRPCAPPVPGSGVRPAEYPNHTALSGRALSPAAQDPGHAQVDSLGKRQSS